MRRGIKAIIGDAARHQGFRRYLFNTSWLFVEQILRMIAGLFVGIYVARYLGPEQFGTFSYVLAYVSFFATVAKLGLDDIVVRELVNYPTERDTLLGAAFWLKAAGALALLGLLASTLVLADNDRATNLYILMIGSGMIFQSFEVVEFYFRSKVLAKYVSICKLVQLVLSSALKVYLVYVQADLVWFVAVSVFDQASLAASLSYAYWRKGRGKFYRQFNRHIAAELIGKSMPLIVSGFIVSVYMRADQVLLKELLGAREVGLYAAASKLTEALYFVPMIIASSLFPSIVSARNAAENVYVSRLSILYKTLLFLGFIVSAVLSLYASAVVDILYGVKYAQAADVLRIHIWILPLICFSAVFGKWLISENNQYLSPYFTLSALVINLAGNFLLIPRFSVQGAAWAALLSQLVPFCAFFLLHEELRTHLVRVARGK